MASKTAVTAAEAGDRGSWSSSKLLAPTRALNFVEWIALIWFILDAFTHLSIEFLYVFFTWTADGAKNSSSPLANIWKLYGKADARWEVYDTNVLSLEMLTVFVMGPLALLMVYGILKRAPWRHVLQIIICTSELYGGWMTFAPEWFSRPVANPNLSNDPIHVYIYLFFMNALWVWVPAILLYDSCVLLTKAASTAKLDARDETPSTRWSYIFIAATLVLYVILVPAIVGTAKL